MPTARVSILACLVLWLLQANVADAQVIIDEIDFSCFGDDGDVDGEDFGVFVGNFGRTGEGLCGDFDYDYDVDYNDFGVFVREYNRSNAPVTSGGVTSPTGIPEPSAFLLGLIGLATCSIRRCRHRMSCIGG